ncbi:hypothetical protein DYU11_16820 [Fibrisoma montanum]|uniref:Transposase (putative) YhgA-like domain-containing protein n=1 Tax=Fibrisoma montanum TaxID=2305895 RepID=A0A418M993_9BACT|nr:hypothetical protein DYU11_16820 [Fibrisoma montanum]
MLNRWQEDAQHKRCLTPVIPVIIYHGPRRWLYQPLTSSMTAMDVALRRYVPVFDYVLIDLSLLTSKQ